MIGALDVKSQLYRVVTESILEGTYQNMTALMQVTTDPRWKDKWTHQLTKEDTEHILKENKSFLESAKKNHWIVYPS